MKALLAKGARANGTDTWGNTPLLLAAREGHTEAVRMLIKAGALIDGRDGAMSPLAASALRGHTATVRFLISNDADINAAGLGGQAPLLLAVKLNRLEVAKVLLDAGASTAVADRSDYSLLMVAVNENHPDMLSLLLSKGLDPNQADSSGLPPLYWTELLKLDDLSRRLRDAGGRADKQSTRAALGAPFESGGY
jgi:ankyrin repeat protein